MANLERIQANNANLQECIDKANTLPDANGGGGSIETCTVTIEVAQTLGGELQYVVAYTNANGVAVTEELTSDRWLPVEYTLTVAKNTLLFCEGYPTLHSGDVQAIDEQALVYIIKGDAFFGI